MKKHRIKAAVLLTGLAVAVSIILFVVNFMRQDISHEISDWAALGNYIGGIISPILAILNLYLFYILTTATTKFTEDNTIKQLCFNTCNDYQKRINELIFECLYNIELYQENNNSEKYKRIAQKRLVWLKYYANSFYEEVASLLPAQDNFKSSMDNFESSINKLIDSNFEDPSIMDEFITKKSDFINNVLSSVINTVK